jgi:hypothetical protein
MTKATILMNNKLVRLDRVRVSRNEATNQSVSMGSLIPLVLLHPAYTGHMIKYNRGKRSMVLCEGMTRHA